MIAVVSRLTTFCRGNPRSAGAASTLPGTWRNRAIGLALIRVLRDPPRGAGISPRQLSFTAGMQAIAASWLVIINPSKSRGSAIPS